MTLGLEFIKVSKELVMKARLAAGLEKTNKHHGTSNKGTWQNGVGSVSKVLNSGRSRSLRHRSSLSARLCHCLGDDLGSQSVLTHITSLSDGDGSKMSCSSNSSTRGTRSSGGFTLLGDGVGLTANVGGDSGQGASDVLALGANGDDSGVIVCNSHNNIVNYGGVGRTGRVNGSGVLETRRRDDGNRASSRGVIGRWVRIFGSTSSSSGSICLRSRSRGA